MPRLPEPSPFAPDAFPVLPPIGGLAMQATACALRYRDRLDCALFRLAPGTTVAGAFTRSTMRAAPVDWSAARLAEAGGIPPSSPLALLANAGNANAFTGAAGVAAVEACADALARHLAMDRRAVFLASTGVIGERLSVENLTGAVPLLASNLEPDSWERAARAIMTTDTYPKGAAQAVTLGGAKARLAGIAKGSGMIAPDMGTMLGFLFTDAAISRPLLQEALRGAVEESFNAISVDGDQSTSDMLLLFATGHAEMAPITQARDPRLPAFQNALDALARDLAMQIIRDGEGITRTFAVDVTGAVSSRSARKVAMAIVNSPLVKCAIAGADPNWGRVVMAIGKSGERADRDKLAIRFGDIEVARDGAIAPGYAEEAAARYMRGRSLRIGVDLGVGQARARAFGCDLTAGYVAINADYRS